MVPSGRCSSSAARGNPRGAAPARVVAGQARLPGPRPDANGRNSPDRRRSGSLRHTEIRVHRQDLISPEQLQDTEHGASTYHQRKPSPRGPAGPAAHTPRPGAGLRLYKPRSRSRRGRPAPRPSRREPRAGRRRSPRPISARSHALA